MKRLSPTEKIDRIYNFFIHDFQSLGISKEDLITGYNLWKTENKVNPHDYIWYTFNSLLHNNAKDISDIISYYKNNVTIYKLMVFFRRKYEKIDENRLYKVYLDNKVILTFEESKYSKYEMQMVEIGVGDCELCRNRNNKYEIKDLIDNLPIDPINCPRGYCAYSLHVTNKRNNFDRIIRNDIKEPQLSFWRKLTNFFKL